jgi:hypothetical protein
MPPRQLVRAFLAFYATLGLVVLVESIRTITAALATSARFSNPTHALVLGSLEIVAAILFLIPRTMRAGSAGLLVIFALAFLLHALEGHPNLVLLVYGAGVLFVRVHGVEDRYFRAAAA